MSCSQLAAQTSCGLAVEGGVNATVQDAMAESYNMIVVSDCIAAFSEDAFNERVHGTFPPRASIMTRHEALDAISPSTDRES